MLLHAVVLIGAIRHSWSTIDRPPVDAPSVLWLTELTMPITTVPEPDMPQERDLPADDVPETEASADTPAESQQIESQQPESPVTEQKDEPSEALDDAPVAADPGEASDPDDAPAPDDRSTPDDGGRNYIVRDVDLNEARRRAIEQTVEQLERDDGYLTFSLDDVREPAPLVEPGPSESVFEAAERSAGGPSLMSPGNARSHLARRVLDLCNTLTGGGIGLMGFASICADAGEPARLFAHLKPAYLRSRPECEEVEGADALVDPDLAIKCRLVLVD